MDYWTEDESLPPGMWGGRGEIPRAEITPDADFEVHPSTGEEVPIELHPRCSARVGSDRCDGWADAALSQHLIYEHDPPAGRLVLGRPYLDRTFSIWLCIEVLRSPGRDWQPTAWSRKDIGGVGIQAQYLPGQFASRIVIANYQDSMRSGTRMWWEGENDWCVPIIYDDTMQTSPSTVILLQGEESGGGRVQVHLEIWCHAFACTKDAYAEISFASPNGITVREIAVIPHWTMRFFRLNKTNIVRYESRVRLADFLDCFCLIVEHEF